MFLLLLVLFYFISQEIYVALHASTVTVGDLTSWIKPSVNSTTFLPHWHKMYILKKKQMSSLLSDILYIRVYYLLYLKKKLKFVAICSSKKISNASATITN